LLSSLSSLAAVPLFIVVSTEQTTSGPET